MPHTLDPPEEVAKNPEARAADLMAAFADPSIRGIFSTIGGDDSIRLLPYVDFELIRSNPKVFIGYSDTTISHLMCFRAGLVSFYGPSIMAGFGENAGLFPYMVDSVRRSLFETDTIGVIEPHREMWCVEPLSWADPENQNLPRKREPATERTWLQGSGVVEGPLIGGCTEVLEKACTSSLWPARDRFEGAILFIETSEEGATPDMLAGWVRGYGEEGLIERIGGLICGRPGGGIPAENFGAYDRALVDVVREFGRPDLPIVTRMEFGHTDPMFVLPFGVRARLDCERREFSILESAVSPR